jgi:hypothetical protein
MNALLERTMATHNRVIAAFIMIAGVILSAQHGM